jgi:hypothetical protein
MFTLHYCEARDAQQFDYYVTLTKIYLLKCLILICYTKMKDWKRWIKE